MPWSPPLRLAVRARFSHPASQLLGTTGFGFWNDPFVMTGGRLPWLPGALWFFFASPPRGPAPGLSGSARRPAHEHPGRLPLLWPPIQRAVHFGKALVPADMTTWHTYVLDWVRDRARFIVDPPPVRPGDPFLEAPSPRGPQGLILWIDNQYLVITPQGRFRWGMLDVPHRQWMEIDHVTVEAT